MWQSHMPGTSVLPLPSMIWAPAGGFTSAAGPSAAIKPLSTTTVCSDRKCRLSASNNLTLVKATGVVGTLANDLANVGIRAASASPCAFCSFSRSLSYPSGNHEIPTVRPKNLLFALVQTGIGELPRPETAQAVTVFFLSPLPISRLVSFSALALPPGSNGSDLSGLCDQALNELGVELHRPGERDIKRRRQIRRAAGVDRTFP